MADTTASPLEGLMKAAREAQAKGGLPGATRPPAYPPTGAQPLRAEPRMPAQPERSRRGEPGRLADRVPPPLTRADPAPIFEDPAFEPHAFDDWGADPLAVGRASAGASLSGFGDARGGRLRGARRGLFLGGGLLSLALVGLMGVWGYKVVLREVMGVPVVEAEAGPMRVEPEDPGGVITADTGLAVNAVAADGTAAPPSDVLTLAPLTAGLAPEDMAVAQTDAEAGEVLPEGIPDPATAVSPEDALEAIPPAAPGSVQPAAAEAAAVAVARALPGAPVGTSVLPVPVEGPMSQADVVAVADAVAAETIPLSASDPGLTAVATSGLPSEAPAAATIPLGAVAAPSLPGTVAPVAASAVEAPPAVLVPASTPGVAVAVRPPPRPAGRASAAAPAPEPAVAATPAPEAAPEQVALTGDIPAGTSLVQLGAFDSPEVAAAEWERLQGPFGEFLQGKSRVIQEAESGGRTFFRLRALGFEDLADARRLCAALVAEDAGCIPVVVQ